MDIQFEDIFRLEQSESKENHKKVKKTRKSLIEAENIVEMLFEDKLNKRMGIS